MNSRHTCRLLTIVVVLFMGITTTCAAESTSIRIRFVDGKSGRPLHLKYYEAGEGHVEAGNYKVEKVEGDSLIVTFHDVSEFSFRSGQFAPCDTSNRRLSPPKYSLHEIAKHGVVAPNYCGKTSTAPEAGVLLIYSRHQHWWEISGNVLRGLLICG